MTRFGTWRTTRFFLYDGIDTLIICTPNFHHIHVLRDAIVSRRKHFMRKTTVHDDSGLLDEGFGTKALYCGKPAVLLGWMEYRYIRSIKRLIDEVDKGTVGNLHGIHPGTSISFLKKVGTWNRLKKNTGDTLVEKCCHFFDLMNRIAGPEYFPKRVIASGGQNVNHLDEVYGGEKANILDNAYVIVEYDNNGPRMLLELCMFAEASKNQEEISIIGNKGKLEAFAPAHQMKSK